MKKDSQKFFGPQRPYISPSPPTLKFRGSASF